MLWQHNPYAIPLLFGALVLVSFAIYAWQYRANRATTLFIIYTTATAVLLVAYAGELSFADLPTITIWARIEYVATFLPAIFLLFVLSYTRRNDNPSPLLLAAIFAPPVINTTLAFTNDFHHLIWASTSTVEVEHVVYFVRTFAAPAMILQGIEVISGIAAMVLLWLEFGRGTPTMRWQAALLTTAGLLPLAGYLLSIRSAGDPLPPLRSYMLGFAASCIPIGYSLFRYQLLDILPAAYGLVVTSMKDAVIVVNTEQRIVSANPAAAEMIGQPAGKLVGLAVEKAFAAAPAIAEKLRTIGDAHTEVSLGEKPDQQVFDLMVSPLQMRNGRLAGHVIVLHDVTTRILAELAAARAAARLEERNQMLDTYSHTVAHDLKSPLHIMLGYMDLVRMEMPAETPPHLKSYINLAADATIGMAEMIDNLLLLARLDDVQTVAEVVELQPVAEAAVEGLREHIDAKHVSIDIGEDLPDVIGYGPWLEHVFSNLVGNAIKYIGKDNTDPRITIRGKCVDGVARFEVEDNGLGIRLDDQKSLFERFSRFHKAEAPGSGLGLTIVAMIVRRLDGTLGVESEPGHGTTFWFELPCPPESPAEPEMAGDPASMQKRGA